MLTRLTRFKRALISSSDTYFCLCLKTWFYQCLRVAHFSRGILSVVVIIYHKERHEQEQYKADCRWHMQRHKRKKLQQHLTRTKSIMPLKAKRLDETGKVYFLESTYTQITVTFLARLTAQG